MFEYCYPPVLVQCRFHWRPVGSLGSKCNNMLVFDTVAESFRRLRTPVEGSRTDPFEMKGELGLYDYNGETADLWVLEDYDANFWSFKYSIKLETPILFLVPDEQGDVFIVSHQSLEHLSGGSSVATRHEWNILHNLMRHRLKESLVRHDFFPAQGNGGADETMLFRGLSNCRGAP
uniref:Uncharacterized protein n=1 Tax=Avena sativa TaxID=4498 RepID=A0ACD5TDC2_AVESA